MHAKSCHFCRGTALVIVQQLHISREELVLCFCVETVISCFLSYLCDYSACQCLTGLNYGVPSHSMGSGRLFSLHDCRISLGLHFQLFLL